MEQTKIKVFFTRKFMVQVTIAKDESKDGG